MIPEGLLNELGFDNNDEFVTMTASIDLSAPGAVERFKDWQHNDGTKKGLVTLTEELGTISYGS